MVLPPPAEWARRSEGGGGRVALLPKRLSFWVVVRKSLLRLFAPPASIIRLVLLPSPLGRLLWLTAAARRGSGCMPTELRLSEVRLCWFICLIFLMESGVEGADDSVPGSRIIPMGGASRCSVSLSWCTVPSWTPAGANLRSVLLSLSCLCLRADPPRWKRLKKPPRSSLS